MNFSSKMRLATKDDEPFLYEVYASTRREETEAWGMETEQAEAFLRMQWHAQSRAYALQFPSAVTHVLTDGTGRIGRCMLCETAEHIRIVDLSLLPGHRGTGHGTVILEGLQRQACRQGKTIVLSVRKSSPAQRLYARLGFEITGSDELCTVMQWTPETADRI